MPGIAFDGSEDLPKEDSLGLCPFCYLPATHMAKDMVGTRFCKSGHKWPNYMSLLAVPFSQTPVPSEHIPESNWVYGLCPTCGTPGTSRARDIEGTTYCMNGHEWKTHPMTPPKNNETKPIATEQNSVYHSSHQTAQQVDDLIESLTKRIASLEEQFEFFRKYGR